MYIYIYILFQTNVNSGWLYDILFGFLIYIYMYIAGPGIGETPKAVAVAVVCCCEDPVLFFMCKC